MNQPKSFIRSLDAKLGEKRSKPLEIKNPVIVWDPPQLVELRKELRYHQDIVEKLGSNTDDIPTILGLLASEVDIVMDGYYTDSQLLDVADKITQRLRDKRGALIVISGDSK